MFLFVVVQVVVIPAQVPQDVTAYEDRIQVDEWQKRGTVHCYVFVLLVDVVPVP